jgi:hypothetical protein
LLCSVILPPTCRTASVNGTPQRYNCEALKNALLATVNGGPGSMNRTTALLKVNESAPFASRLRIALRPAGLPIPPRGRRI